MKRPLMFGVAFTLIAATFVFFNWIRLGSEPSTSPFKKTAKPSQPISVNNSEFKDEAEKPAQIASQGMESMSRIEKGRETPLATVATIKWNTVKTESVDWLLGTRWKIWRGVHAVERKWVSASKQEIIGEVSGYLLIRNNISFGRKDSTSVKHFVVVDPRLQVAGVVTGVLKVLLKEGANSDFLVQNSNLRIRDAFSDIRTYYVAALEEPFDPLVLKEFLSRQPEVEQVELEIVFKKHEKF